LPACRRSLRRTLDFTIFYTVKMTSFYTVKMTSFYTVKMTSLSMVVVTPTWHPIAMRQGAS
jgi:hypothetical protein